MTNCSVSDSINVNNHVTIGVAHSRDYITQLVGESRNVNKFTVNRSVDPRSFNSNPLVRGE